MDFQRRLVLILLVMAGSTGQARALQSTDRPITVDVATVGPQVGDRLPEFTLHDQHGEARSLASLLGPNGAMIVFFRSADW